MNYLGYLLFFMIVPSLAVWGLQWRDAPLWRPIPDWFRRVAWHLPMVFYGLFAMLYFIFAHLLIAPLRVWQYDEALTMGIVLGGLPLEAYLSLVIQALFVGLWFIFFVRHVRIMPKPRANPLKTRQVLTGVLLALWLISVVVYFTSHVYIALLIVVFLPLYMIQTALVGDVVWQYRLWIVLAVVPATVYLCIAETVGINGGLWHIKPEYSLNIFIGNTLTLEEFLLSLMLNLWFAVSFSWTLAQSRETANA